MLRHQTIAGLFICCSMQSSARANLKPHSREPPQAPLACPSHTAGPRLGQSPRRVTFGTKDLGRAFLHVTASHSGQLFPVSVRLRPSRGAAVSGSCVKLALAQLVRPDRHLQPFRSADRHICRRWSLLRVCASVFFRAASPHFFLLFLPLLSLLSLLFYPLSVPFLFPFFFF